MLEVAFSRKPNAESFYIDRNVREIMVRCSVDASWMVTLRQDAQWTDVDGWTRGELVYDVVVSGDCPAAPPLFLSGGAQSRPDDSRDTVVAFVPIVPVHCELSVRRAYYEYYGVLHQPWTSTATSPMPRSTPRTIRATCNDSVLPARIFWI